MTFEQGGWSSASQKIRMRCLVCQAERRRMAPIGNVSVRLSASVQLRSLIRPLAVIEISLTDPAFRGGKPGFERVRSLLRNWPRSTNLWAEIAGVAQPSDGEGGKTFDMLFSFVNAEGELALRSDPRVRKS